jgi:hypothetical protein
MVSLLRALWVPECNMQVCGGYPDAMSHLAQLLDENIDTDFVDINCGEAGLEDVSSQLLN